MAGGIFFRSFEFFAGIYELQNISSLLHAFGREKGSWCLGSVQLCVRSHLYQSHGAVGDRRTIPQSA